MIQILVLLSGRIPVPLRHRKNLFVSLIVLLKEVQSIQHPLREMGHSRSTPAHSIHLSLLRFLLPSPPCMQHFAAKRYARINPSPGASHTMLGSTEKEDTI